MNVSAYIKDQSIYETGANNRHDAMTSYYENDKQVHDVFTYTKTHRFELNNLAMLEKDDNGHYFIELDLKRSDVDIAGRFEHNANKLELVICGYHVQIDSDALLAPVFAPYSPLTLRLTFADKRDIVLTYTCYMIVDYATLHFNQIVSGSGVVYDDGVARPSSA
jgi:hypothetical protein